MERNRLVTSVGIVGVFTLLSRFLGLVRDVLMAGFFGTSQAMGGFVIAFTLPNLFRRLFGEGALSAAFIPVFIDTRAKGGLAAAWRLAHRVLSLLAVVLTLLTLVGILAATVGLAWVEPNGMAATVLRLARIMLPYMIFICLVALCMAILNSFHHFAVPAATSSILNIVWIGTLLVLVPVIGETLEQKVTVVAWAVLVAGLLQLLVQWPILKRHGYRLQFRLPEKDPRVKRVLVLMGPAALGMGVGQVNVILDKLLAGWIGPWAPAALFYSERLIYFPLGIFATALSTVLLPVFSGHVSARNDVGLKNMMRDSLGYILFIMVPASVGLAALAGPIVSMIFEWGEFGEVSHRQTTIALLCYAPGLTVFSLAKVFVPVFYAHQDTRTPVYVGLGAVALNLTLNLLAVWTWPYAMKHGGLAFATVLSSTFNVFILAYIVHRRIGSPGWTAIARRLFRCLVLSALMGGLCIFLERLLLGVLLGWGWPAKSALILSVGLAIAVGGAFYLTLSMLLGAPEMKEMVRILRSRRARRSAAE